MSYTLLKPSIDSVAIAPNPVDAGATMIVKVEVSG